MKFIITTLLFVILIGCAKQQVKTTVPTETNVALEELIESPEAIPLETAETSLIATVTKLIVEDDKFIVMDGGTKSVVVFSEQGKWLGRIRNHGRASNEYLELTDIDVCDGYIYILSRIDKKIQVYDISATHLKTIFLDDFYCNLHIVNPDNIILYSEWANATGYNFVQIDSRGEIISRTMPFSHQNGYIFEGSPFNESEDGDLLLTFPYDETIYAMSINGDCKPLVHLQFDTELNIEDIDKRQYNDIVAKYKYKNVLKRIQYVSEIDGRLFLVAKIFFNELGYRQSLIEVTEYGEVKVYRLGDVEDENYPHFYNIVGFDGSYVYTSISAQMYGALDLNNNPIIIRYRIRNKQ